MSEHPNVVTPYDVRSVSFEPDGKLGILVSVCERFRQFVVFLSLPLIFVRVFS